MGCFLVNFAPMDLAQCLSHNYPLNVCGMNRLGIAEVVYAMMWKTHMLLLICG